MGFAAYAITIFEKKQPQKGKVCLFFCYFCSDI